MKRTLTNGTMRQISTILAVLLASLIFFSAISYGASPIWPLKGAIDFASGYGDYRPDRFHAGFDLRTGGAVGAPVYAPADGYISRINMAYTGYGKVLYMLGSDGHMYVFGHLSGFYPALDTLVKRNQRAQQRYYVNLNFPADSLAVKQGQLLAFSGQTGIGAPHLHFETRTRDNRPLNPLLHGFTVPDRVAPTFVRIGFMMADDESFLPNGDRQIFLSAKEQKKGRFVADSVLYLNRPFGLSADCFDRILPDGMKLSVFDLSLTIDDSLVYEARLDTLTYETGGAADMVYDFDQVVKGHDDTRRLYTRPGFDFPGWRSLGKSLGVVGESGLAIGRHAGRIRATDAAGNSSDLEFKFYWGPRDNVLVLDSISKPNDTDWSFHFHPIPEYKGLNVSRVLVELNRDGRWGVTPSATSKWTSGGRLVVEARGAMIDMVPLRLALVTRDKCLIQESIFSGLLPRASQRLGIKYDLTDDGLVVTADLQTRRATRCRLELYYQGKLLGRERPKQFLSADLAKWLIIPQAKYARIDRIGVATTEDTVVAAQMLDSLDISVVGLEDTTVMAPDSFFTVIVPKSSVYQPRFMSVKRIKISNRDVMHMVSDHYQILPERFVLRAPFILTLRPLQFYSSDVHAALFRLDKQHDRWSWITDSTRDNVFYGSSRPGGSFAAVYDIEPPDVTEVYPAHEETISTPIPVIRFKVKDNLSGIENDRNFSVKIDSRWQIPEYDPESGTCEVRLLDPLTPGEHHLSIEVKDRAGNQGYSYTRFRYNGVIENKKGK